MNKVQAQESDGLVEIFATKKVKLSTDPKRTSAEVSPRQFFQCLQPKLTSNIKFKTCNERSSKLVVNYGDKQPLEEIENKQSPRQRKNKKERLITNITG